MAKNPKICDILHDFENNFNIKMHRRCGKSIVACVPPFPNPKNDRFPAFLIRISHRENIFGQNLSREKCGKFRLFWPKFVLFCIIFAPSFPIFLEFSGNFRKNRTKILKKSNGYKSQIWYFLAIFVRFFLRFFSDFFGIFPDFQEKSDKNPEKIEWL